MTFATAFDVMNQPVFKIHHPLISELYIKREYVRNNIKETQDVLVIETNFQHQGGEHDIYSSKLAELYMALPEIKEHVEYTMGSIDRVDIKTH